MKFFISLFVAFLMLSTSAFAESLSFAWEYSPEDQALITGFKLYRDGNILEPVNITAAARTVVVPRQTDKRSHTYHLTAYSTENESGPSSTAIDAYVATKIEPVTGVLTIKVIP